MPKRKAQPQRMTESLVNKRARQAVGQAKFKKDQITAIRNIARSVALRAAETKSKLSTVSGSLFDAVVYGRNICYNLSQGTTSETYIGEKIFLKNFHFKGQIAFNGTTERDKSGRLMIIYTDTQLTTSSSFSALTTSDVFRVGTSGLPSQVLHADLHKVRVLYDQQILVKKQYSTHVPIYAFDINLHLNKVETFTGDNNGTFKNGQYFFIFMADDLSSANMASIAFDYTVNFKDE